VPLGGSLVLAAVATAALAALVIGLSWLIASLWCAPKRRARSKTPSDCGLSYGRILFSSGKVPVRGSFIGSAFESGPAKAVIPTEPVRLDALTRQRPFERAPHRIPPPRHQLLPPPRLHARLEALLHLPLRGNLLARLP
jgi:hypothetical protein